MLSTKEIDLVKSSWSSVLSIKEIAGPLFYATLFELDPSVKALFHSPVETQANKLLSMLGNIISKLDKLEDVIENINMLAYRHVHYGVKEEHYALVGEALLKTLENGLGSAWNSELKDAWTKVYTILAGTMIKASNYNLA
jgi:hemoglobin-like flavoprotein